MAFDCLRVSLLLHNKRKCDFVANSGSCVTCNNSTFIKPLQLINFVFVNLQFNWHMLKLKAVKFKIS